MPLITLASNDLTLATPLVALNGTVLAFVIAGSSLRQMDIASAWRLIASGFVGIPFGLAVLLLAPATIVKSILGVFLIGFSLYNLTRPVLPYLKQQRWAYLFGFTAGILGGAYNIGGPPLILYGSLRRWSPARFRATLQGYFAVTGIYVLVLHGLSGLWTTQVWQLFLLSIPLQIIAVWVGGKFNRHIPIAVFSRLLYVALIFLGVLLLL